jgi:putative ABC transport system ATP-binding protein
MITLENVAKHYQMGTVKVVALDGISLHVDPGEFVVVLGPSGSGKSTLLNMISALDSPTKGTVIVNGQDVTRAGQKDKFTFRRHTIGFIFQTFNLFPSLTARENVQFAVDLRGRRDANGLTEEILDSVGLAPRMDHFPHELSGGEQQRVAIARALATGNPVLLADEPTGELDFRTGIQILELLEAQAHEGKAVLVVTHNREISRIADRVIELGSGEIVSDGPPWEGRADIADLHW